jgi:hypothetical protein
MTDNIEKIKVILENQAVLTKFEREVQSKTTELKELKSSFLKEVIVTEDPIIEAFDGHKYLIIPPDEELFFSKLEIVDLTNIQEKIL